MPFGCIDPFPQEYPAKASFSAREYTFIVYAAKGIEAREGGRPSVYEAIL